MAGPLEGNSITYDAGYGKLAVVDTGGPKPPLLFIHGNSACKEVFHRQFASKLADRNRLIAFDLPGHGASDRADDPTAVYRMGPIAELIQKLLGDLDAKHAVLFGWSLGGHIALEMAAAFDTAPAIAIQGTPPFGPGRGEIMEAFNQTDAMALASKETFSDEEARLYASTILDAEAADDPVFLEAIKTADGKLREVAVGDWAMNDGAGHVHRDVIASWQKPIAVIQGEHEPFVNRDWMASLTWINRWGDKDHVIEGAGHAPFLEKPEAFNALLLAFLEDVVRG